MTCPLCRSRRGKRLCPAKGERICSQCCGTKRRVEIDCPPDCAFLDGAHAGAWDGRSADRDRDARRIGPFLEGLTEAQGRLVLLSLVGTTAIRARRRDFDDRLFLEAVQALRKTVETREKGILYEHPPGTRGLTASPTSSPSSSRRETRRVTPTRRPTATSPRHSRGWSGRSKPPSAGGVRPRLPRHRHPPRRTAGPAPGRAPEAGPDRGALTA